MKEGYIKYIFYISSVLLLLIMMLTVRDAGINCDEVLHYEHSVSVYNYFASHGVDRSALSTPVTHLQFYGQAFDNIATILIRWFDIDDIYGFRHLLSSFAGWIVILLTALFAVWLSGYRAGIMVVVLFALSPTFLGHSQNNLKDIPFALGYISSVYFSLKFITSGKHIPVNIALLLTLSIAIALSIRAGGILLYFYLFLFFFMFYLVQFIKFREFNKKEILQKLLWVCGIMAASWILSVLLWPYALQSPVKNVIESYRVMAHFPDTFRQIFEGKVEWSDYMPWYYLPKSMLITIPFTILAGLLLFTIYSGSKLRDEKGFIYTSIIFTLIFPIVFVIAEKSNLYSSWRQFIFLYPGLVLISSVGFISLYQTIRNRYLKWTFLLVFCIFSLHPLRFMITNHPYYYLYYNQIVGGLKGAWSNYETDYYYVTQTEASKWLINYLKDHDKDDQVKVKSTYTVKWDFRNNPEIETSYFRWEERSQSEWDYAIVVNRYITPYQLRNGIWPPQNAIHTINADNVPVCAVVERHSEDDWLGYKALKEGRNDEAISFFEEVLKINSQDELIFYNFAVALYNDGQYEKADSILKQGLKVNPDFEPILMYLGNIAKTQNRFHDAIVYYNRLIKVNRKYFEAYVELSGLLSDSDILKARRLLRVCLTISPRYKPAIKALADTYRESNPDIAKKYDELANTIN